MALKPRSTLPVPMISVTSYRRTMISALSNAVKLIQTTHAGVVGLEESDLDALVLEVALGLRQVQWCMVGGGVPL